jgi:hypothetical protein
MPFNFNDKRNEVNDAYGSIIIPLSQLSMNDLALGDPSSTPVFGQADTFYTDNPNINSINTANSDMFTNYAPNYFSIPTGETSAYFNNTFAGDPMPLKDNASSSDFHGTCKPVALGDYIDSNSTDPALEGSFATAGISSGDVYVSVFKTDATVSPMVPVWQCSANCGISMSGADSDVRLFAYPGLDISSNEKIIVVIVNDFGNSFLYFFMFNWDFNANTLTLVSTEKSSSTTPDNIKYTGQHDIFYLPTSNSLFLLRKDGVLEEIFINPPSIITLITSIGSITAVAYDDVNGVIVATDTSGTLTTYVGTISAGLVNTVGSAIPPSLIAFDGCYNKTVDSAGFYFCVIDSGGQLISYRFDVNSSGVYTTSNSHATSVGTIYSWTQVEAQAYNVINIGVGPNNSSGVKTARLVCDSATLRPAYSEYNNSTVEDFILMRHPSGSDNSINNNPASGSNHLICVDNGSTITTHGKNFLNEVEVQTSTTILSSLNQYIIYLGYCYNSITTEVNYLYLAISGLSGSAPFDINGNPTGGYYLYFNYDA